MKDAASDVPTTRASDSHAPFVESESHKTRLPYDDGGVPLYVAVAWAAFIVAYITIMSTVMLPDLLAWLSN